MNNNLRKSTSTVKKSAIFLIVILVIASSIISYYVYQSFKSIYLEDAEIEMQSEAITIKNVISELQNQALSVAISVSRLEDIKSAYYEKDSLKALQILNSSIKPIIKEIKSNLKLKKYKVHFHKPPARSFLREWNQTGGDELSGFRNTILHVYETHSPLKCIELGKGGFAIRGISPIFGQNNEYLGSVEVFFEIQDIFPFINNDFKEFGFVVLANKKEVDRLFFQKEKEQYFKGEIGSHIIVENNINKNFDLKTQINDSFLQQSGNIKQLNIQESGNFTFASIPINDFVNKEVGNIIFVFDRTKELQSSRQKIIIITSFVIGLGVFLIVFIIFLMKNLIKRFDEYNTALETSLEQAKDARLVAENADRSKSEFLANMSHEIRTPLNAVLGYSEILTGKINEPSQINYLQGIITSGKSLLHIINDILDLSKIEAGRIELQMSAVNPHKLIDEIRQVFGIKIKDKGLKFNISVDEKLPDSLVLDDTRLRQVLFNLIGNAIKFTNNGEIKIDVFSKINIDEYAISTVDLVIKVKDTGIGIKEEDLDRIFSAFQQQKGQSIGKFGGTGLGLTISKRLTEKMGGQLLVESKEGVGSTFTLELKEINIASVKPDDNSDQLHGNIKLKKSRVLLAEDVESNRIVVRGFLETHDVEIIEAENGEVAVKMAKEMQPDAILMDIHMPIMNGFEATRLIKSNPETKDIPVIALTASVFKHQETEIRELCNSYLRKPVSKLSLINELGKYLPYKELDKETQNTEENNSTKEQIEIEDIKSEILNHEQVTRLQAEINDLFHADFDILQKSMSTRKIAEFATKMEEYASQNQLKSLAFKCKSLQIASSTFNVKEMKSIMNEIKTIFP